MNDLNERLLLYYNKKNIKKNTNIIRGKFIRGCAKLFNYHPVFHRYAGKKIISRWNTNTKIASLIDSGKPFVVSRFGSTELNNMAFYQMKKMLHNSDEMLVWNTINSKVGLLKEEAEVALKALDNWCGFFPVSEENISRFNDIMLDSITKIDILATWDINMEEYFIEYYMPDVILSDLYYIEPWLASNPWSAKLKGKKVLIIHPFEETILSQYKKRTEIFKDPNVLPEFELLTLKAVQTLAGNRDERFADWFEALEYMYKEAMKMDFDIAILGCGAYGMPLAVKLKMAGKQAIHLGGATQLLFGIKGSRWEADNYPTKVAKLFNDSWVRPGTTDNIKGGNIVENACYW